MNKIRLVIADDHAVLQAGLESMLNAEPDMIVVGSAVDGLVAVQQVQQLQPDVVLMDLNMPGLSGLAAIVQLRTLAPTSRILVLTMHDDAQYLRQAMASGAAGYVLKQAAGKELLSAIRTVYAGGIYLHPAHALALVAPPLPSVDSSAQAGISEAQTRYALLSERETEVFAMIALGYRNSEIANNLSLSVKTIETYKSRMMEKLGLQSRASLVRLALELGILDSPPPS